MSDFAKGEPQALAKRGITEEACRKYGYWIGKDKHGKTVQIANYKRDGGIVAQKLRYPDKKFSFIGDSKACGLFGQHLYEPGRRLVITEGEIDALSVAQALGLRWPVVSVPNGAQGAAKSIKRELEWVNGFDEVVLMFDMDEPGQAAAQEVALLLTPGKAKIAQLPAKDPNELLQRGDAEAITRAIYEAQTKRPDGVVTFGSLKEKALKPVSMGMPWHDPRLTALTYGKRYGEVYTFLSANDHGTGEMTVRQAVERLKKAKRVVGHNIAGFDIPAIAKVFPDFKVQAYFDTLLMSTLVYPDLKDRDFKARKKQGANWCVPGQPGEGSLLQGGRRRHCGRHPLASRRPGALRRYLGEDRQHRSGHQRRR